MLSARTHASRPHPHPLKITPHPRESFDKEMQTFQEKLSTVSIESHYLLVPTE